MDQSRWSGYSDSSPGLDFRMRRREERIRIYDRITVSYIDSDVAKLTSFPVRALYAYFRHRRPRASSSNVHLLFSNCGRLSDDPTTRE